MKLKKILKYLDYLEQIRIVCFYPKDQSEEEYFNGSAIQCPYWVADLPLDTTNDWDPISIIKEDDKGKPLETPYLEIWVKEE